MKINVKMNPKYIPYYNKPQFTQIFFGGSSSGKSYFLAQKIVIDNMQGVNWLVCRNVARTMRNSVFNEIIKSIGNMGMLKYYSVNKSDMLITNNINSKQIMFAGLDDVEKVKSITPKCGVLERVFVEEATEIKYEAYKQLCKRLRGETEFAKCVILAFNPILKSHWIYREFFDKWVEGKNAYEDSNLAILKTTYKDNKFLTQDDIQMLEEETDEYYKNVYTYGNWGILGHVIFKNWHLEDLSEQKKHFDNIYCGMDFGYSSDPNALIKIHLDKKRKKLYVLDEWYQSGMSDEELLAVSREFFGNEIVTCDYSENKTIDYLALGGVNAIACVKGPDSINRGIRFLQGFEIIIDVKCQNFKNEIEQYHWLEDKYGNAMAKAVDKDNHLLDALRYAVESEMFMNEVEVGGRLV